MRFSKTTIGFSLAAVLVASAAGGVLLWRYGGARKVSAAEAARPRSHVPGALARGLAEVALAFGEPMPIGARAALPKTAQVLLTFDDGPDHERTPLVLDELAKRNLRAVFFVVGKNLVGETPNAKARREVLLRAVREGHLIGNHTYSHPHLCELEPAAGGKEIDRGAEAIEKVTGIKPVLFRSPFGDKCGKLRKLLEARGLVHTGWDVDPQEWESLSADITYHRVAGELARAKPGRSILLMHDTQKATVAALPRILDWIGANGDPAKLAADDPEAVKQDPIAAIRKQRVVTRRGADLAWDSPMSLMHGQVIPASEPLQLALASLATITP